MYSRIMVFGFVIGLAHTLAFGQYAIDWHTIDGGGVQSSTGGTFALAGTMGQLDAASSPTLIGGTFELIGGFWPVSNVCYCLGDLDQDGQKNGGDIQKFVDCVIWGGACSCADVDSASGVTLDDAEALVDDLLAGDPCP